MKIKTIAGLCCALLLLSGCISFMNEVDFARAVFKGLAKGEQGIERYIAWEQLTAVGSNTGSVYSKIEGEKQKANFRKGFVYNFSQAFQGAEGTLKSYSNWRVFAREPAKITVAVDVKTEKFQKTLLLYLSADSRKRRLLGMDWLVQK